VRSDVRIPFSLKQLQRLGRARIAEARLGAETHSAQLRIPRQFGAKSSSSLPDSSKPCAIERS